MLSIKYLLYNTQSLLYHQIKSQYTSSAKILIGLFQKMLDIKPIFCQLPTHRISTDNFNQTYLSCPTSTFPKSSVSCVYHFFYWLLISENKPICLVSSSHYDNIACSINDHLQSGYIDTVRRHRTKYPDVPKSSRISDKNRSIFSLKKNSM
jgi:hypothetical protein